MPWALPEFSRAEVNQAGMVLIGDSPGAEQFLDALHIANNWRAIHGCPLQSIKMTLWARAPRVDGSAIISQRTKRIPAIQLKLRENHRAGLEMKLTQMHDVGGCRAIMKNVTQAESLVKVYEEAAKKNPKRGSKLHRKYDYIQLPKETGYRGVHLVYKYESDSPSLKAYEDLKIEIQVRSRLQHYWATAVETVDFFTGQALKSNIGALPWKRFFILVANEFARLENRPLVPGAPTDEKESMKELKEHSHQITALEGFHATTDIVASRPPASGKAGGQYFLLQLDLAERRMTPTFFSRDQIDEAQKRYLAIEAKNKDNPTMQTVLVSVDSIAALPKAYPSFYLDISEFVKVLRKILGS